jgi:transposase
LAGFLPVRIVPEEAPTLPAPQPEDGALALTPRREPVRPSRPAGLIEIELPSGVRLRVGTDVDGGALGQVLAALRDR